MKTDYHYLLILAGLGLILTGAYLLGGWAALLIIGGVFCVTLSVLTQ